jgi:acetyl-CoA synthetase
VKPPYADAVRDFRWDAGFAALGWTPDGPVNLCRTLVDRHRASGRVALRWFGKDGRARACTFAELGDAAARFANLLRALGVNRGDRVAGFMPRVPETLAVMLGTWKAGAVYVPIFTGFGPDAIGFRVGHSGARVLCTHEDYRARVPAPLGGGAAVVTVARAHGAGAGVPSVAAAPAATGTGVGADIDFAAATAAQPARGDDVPCRRDEPAVLLYTSGSTGPPKGVEIATNFPLAILPYLRYGVDLRPDDVFWPTGDPGWGYGLVCYSLADEIADVVRHAVGHHQAPREIEVVAELPKTETGKIQRFKLRAG